MSLHKLGTKGDSSEDNTTTTPLTGGATYTGTWEKSDQPDVMVSCQSDVAGTLYFDFSNDAGVTSSTFPVAGFSVAAGIHEFHTALKGPRSFRVRYVNGSAAQSSLSLYTYFGSFPKTPNAPLNQSFGLDSDSTIVRMPFPWLDVARGLVGGLTTIKKFGQNAAVGTSYSPVSLGGIYRTPQASGATTLRVAAGNTNDTAAGSGAREITVQGLDENFNYVSETIATAGTSASSPTTATFTRLYRAFVSASGTYATSAAGSHAAAIVIENGAGGTTWATIGVTDFPKGQSEIGAYSVPTGSTAYVFLKDVSVDSGKTIDLIFFSREGADETSPPYKAMRAKSVSVGVVAGRSLLTGSQIPYGPFTGPCDLGFMARGATNPAVSVEFDVFQITE
jgi:hypothetical protein